MFREMRPFAAKRNMNILFLALDVNPALLRGDSVHTLELARFLGARGVGVQLVTTPGGGSSLEVGQNVTHHVPRGPGDLSILQFCRGIVRKTQCDAIYERRLSPKISFGLSRVLQLPFVIEINGSENEAQLQGIAQPRTVPGFRRWVRRRMYRRAAKVVAVSALLAERVQEAYGLPGDRLAVVCNGVDTIRFQPLDKSECRRRSGWEWGRWIIYVGNLVPWQGLDTLVSSMPQVLARVPDAHLAIIGDGMLRQALVRLASDAGVLERTHFIGSVPHTKVCRLICAADLCVAPFARIRNSEIGLSPLKLYEYLACGRPVVASDVPGVAETIRESGAGELVPAGDPSALSSAISLLLTDEMKKTQLGSNGRNFAINFCSWDIAARRIEATIAGAIADFRQSRRIRRRRS